MDAYWKNVEKVLAGKPKRPAIKRDGTPQSESNQKFRFVHLVLAVAVKKGWAITHFPIENVEKDQHSKVEKQRTTELDCNMNNQGSWAVEDFQKEAKKIT
ncbi:MAG: hypothetical protein WBB82_00650 [Limnothrix sp.]